LELNPFDDLIVKEPHRREPAVPGLNEQPFLSLKPRFERLFAGKPPRPPLPADPALLVTSPQPGFGKSHLIGRLFRKLGGRATLVYLRPFQSAELVFQSLLSTTVKELECPDRTGWSSRDPGEPTQLDALAHAVLGHLVADLMEQQGGADRADIVRIRRNPLEAFARGNPGDQWADWMRQSFPEYRLVMVEAMAARETVLHSKEWLPVLFAYAYHFENREVRQTCIDWICGESLSTEQFASIGVCPAHTMDAEASADQINRLCRERLIDLCRLASYYRPFVFCFDQTEAYGHSPALARAFGTAIATLVDEVPNQLTLITANEEPWEKTILPHFAGTDAERIATPPIELEGLTRAQAEELGALRLKATGLSPEDCAIFLDEEWLGEIFGAEDSRIGTRDFLRLCKARWEEVAVTSDGMPVPAPVASLAAFYEARRVGLLTEPTRLTFDADILRWLVTICAAGLPEMEVESIDSRFFSVRWRHAARTVLFGFEAGSNWKRWGAIVRETESHHAQMPQSKVVLFRGEEQSAIPGPDWCVSPEILEARQQCLHLIVLSRDDFAALHAGYDLYVDALGGDIPPFDTQEVLSFLRAHFELWWERLLGPVDSETPEVGTPDIEERQAQINTAVRGIVAAERYLSVDDVIDRLGFEVRREDVLLACGYSAEIRVHAHPRIPVLQWQSS
jgi:hypothetical protein